MTRHRLGDSLEQFERERELLEEYLATQGEDLRLGCPEPAHCNNTNLGKGDKSNGERDP
jgi:hypothetical protein